jgi:hypothetical protein
MVQEYAAGGHSVAQYDLFTPDIDPLTQQPKLNKHRQPEHFIGMSLSQE